MMDTVQAFLDIVNIFFVLYLIGYSTFLFLSVVIGASDLYLDKEMEYL